MSVNRENVLEATSHFRRKMVGLVEMSKILKPDRSLHGSTGSLKNVLIYFEITLKKRGFHVFVMLSLCFPHNLIYNYKFKIFFEKNVPKLSNAPLSSCFSSLK